MNPALCTCIAFESVIIVHLFFFYDFQFWFFNVTHCLPTYLRPIIFFRSSNGRRLIVAYRCFICSHALKRIKRISYRPYWMIGFWNAISRGAIAFESIISSYSHIFYLSCLISYSFIYFIQPIHTETGMLQILKRLKSFLAITFLKICH